MTELELRATQNSCANCLHVRKPVTYSDPDTWMCRAPENLTNTINVVTGEYYPKVKLCMDVRGNSRVINCVAQKQARIYYSDGSSKSVYQLEAEANRTTARISLRDVKVEDLI